MGAAGDFGEWFDECMMYGATKAVEKWNYVTGRRKKDLANSMLNAGFVSESIGGISTGFLPFYFVPLFSFSTLNFAKRSNRCTECLEDQVADRGVALGSEFYSKEKMLGEIRFVASLALGYFSYHFFGEVPAVLIGGGFALERAS